MGNTHAKRSIQGDEPAEGADSFRVGSPPVSPGSPLTYTPQVAMEPIAHAHARHEHDSSAQRLGTEFVGAAGWPAQPKLVPVEISCRSCRRNRRSTTIIKQPNKPAAAASPAAAQRRQGTHAPADMSHAAHIYPAGSHGGEHVQVEGSFDNWSTRQQLQRSGREFTVVKLLPPGVYQYKFIVDGDWKHDPNQRAMHDENGNVNNVIEVQEYVPENLENISGFDPPPSPSASYNNPHPMAEDYAKEPPVMPPHLQLTLLNVPSTAESTTSLPRPQHVILNHIYVQRGQAVNAMVVGTTHRYKGKYITSVLYKPRGGGSSSSSSAAAGGVRRMPMQQPFAGQQQPLQPQHH